MSYKSKRTIASIVVGIVLIIIYIIFAMKKNVPGAESPDTLRSWAILMLIFLGIGIVASIIVQIIFAIGYSIGVAVKESDKNDKEVERIIESSMFEDEMDKMITLKSEYVGFVIVGIGFVTALITLAAGMSAVFALNITFASFAVGSLASGIASIVGYERGV